MLRALDMRWLGDDTPAGWLITVTYAIAALSTFLAARRAPSGSLRRFLALTSAGLLALGVNKQLDLQTQIFRAGRRAIFALGLYRHRDAFHIAFPILVGVVLVVVLALLLRALRAQLRAVAPMLVGFALLGCFVVLRVARFSHLVRVLGWTWLDSGAFSLLEILAVALIALGAWRAVHR